MSRGSKKTNKKPRNPEGNPNFYTEKNPSKMAQELDEPCIANINIRVPPSWKEKLSKIPASEIREHLKLLISNEEE